METVSAVRVRTRTQRSAQCQATGHRLMCKGRPGLSRIAGRRLRNGWSRSHRGEGRGRPAAPHPGPPGRAADRMGTPAPGTRDCLPRRLRRSSRTAWLRSRPGVGPVAAAVLVAARPGAGTLRPPGGHCNTRPRRVSGWSSVPGSATPAQVRIAGKLCIAAPASPGYQVQTHRAVDGLRGLCRGLGVVSPGTAISCPVAAGLQVPDETGTGRCGGRANRHLDCRVPGIQGVFQRGVRHQGIRP